MKNPLLVSTGSFWDGKTYLDNVEAIRSITQLNVEGIEVSFADQKLLGGFFNQEVKRLLGNFKIVGMHLPFWSYKKDNASQEMISKCYSVYKRIKADYAVLHMHWMNVDSVFCIKLYFVVFVPTNFETYKKIFLFILVMRISRVHTYIGCAIIRHITRNKNYMKYKSSISIVS